MFKLEMHLHVLGTSPCAETDEETIAKTYAKEGYNGIVYTSHYNSFLCNLYCGGDLKKYNELFYGHFIKLKEECAKYGIKVFFGMEVMPDVTSYYEDTTDKAEFLIYGITADDIFNGAEKFLKMTVAEMSETCRKNGWLLGQAHPYRDNITYRQSEFLDCVESINGNVRQNNHNDLADKFADENGLIKTAGSDFHRVEDATTGVYLKREVKNEAELVEELKKREHSVFTA